MSIDAPVDGGPLRQLFGSANFARAYTITVLVVVLSSFVIERTAGLTTYVTMISGLCVLAVAILIARRRELSRWRLMPFTQSSPSSLAAATTSPPGHMQKL